MKDNKDRNIILTYSGLEQSKNGIAGPGRCLINFLGVFPFIPLLLALFSCYIKKIPEKAFFKCLILLTIIAMIFMFIYIAKWIINMMTVFVISEDGNLYRLRISSFWYKVKDKVYLIKPEGMSGGRYMRLFYMINNIKIVLQSVASDITFDEFIMMGKMTRISDISDTKITKKNITIDAVVETKNSKKKSRLSLQRVFEKDEIFCDYLRKYEKLGIEETAKIDFNRKTSVNDLIKIESSSEKFIRKIRRFTINWTCIIAWVAMFTISGDLNRLSKINAGEYIKYENDKGKMTYISKEDDKDYFYESDYGKMYKPVIVIYGSVEFIYLVMKVTDYIIDRKKKES